MGTRSSTVQTDISVLICIFFSLCRLVLARFPSHPRVRLSSPRERGLREASSEKDFPVTRFTNSKTYDSLRWFCINYRIENEQHKKVKGAMSRTFGVTFNDQKTLDQYNGKVEMKTQFCTQKQMARMGCNFKKKSLFVHFFFFFHVYWNFFTEKLLLVRFREITCLFRLKIKKN